MKRLVIVGAGGFGREVFSLIQDINQVQETWDVIGFLDDNPRALDDFPLYPRVLGSDDCYRDLGSPELVCAVGSPSVRKQLVERLGVESPRWATLIHPTASVGLGSTIGEGCILCPRSVVTVDARLGRHVHLNCFSGCGHDSQLGDFCTLSCHVDICGGVVMEEGVFLGSHASVLPKVRVGAWARIGAGSVAMRNVPSQKTVFGIPAKEMPDNFRRD